MPGWASREHVIRARQQIANGGIGVAVAVVIEVIGLFDRPVAEHVVEPKPLIDVLQEPPHLVGVRLLSIRREDCG